jgi:hypothetical protein
MYEWSYTYVPISFLSVFRFQATYISVTFAIFLIYDHANVFSILSSYSLLMPA